MLLMEGIGKLCSYKCMEQELTCKWVRGMEIVYTAIYFYISTEPSNTSLSLDYVTPYVAKDEEKYNYYLNVCGRVTRGGCNEQYVSSCQVKLENNQYKVAGKFAHQTLRCVFISLKFYF